MGKSSQQKKVYTFEEDTQITAQAAVNIVISTRKDVDPVPCVAALLEGYARRVQTGYQSAATPRRKNQKAAGKEGEEH